MAKSKPNPERRRAELRRRLDQAWEGACAEQGWNENSQVAVLRDFVQELAEEDPLVREKFESYLDRRIDEENGYGVEDGIA